MRKIAFLFSVVLCLQVIGLFAQTTQKFNYQAVIRDNDGELIANQQIGVRLTIIESTTSGSELYRESHDVTTSEHGIISLPVGGGSSDVGAFATIDWGSDAKFLKLEIDIGDGFVEMGTFQLFSVPYANYAMEVENKDDADADPTNEIQDLILSNDDVLSITGNSSATEINLAPFTGNNTDEQELTLNGDTLVISNGNEVVLPYDSSKWIINGDQMYYNGGNVGIGSAAPVSNLEVKANSAGTDALFQVINANNDTVFAVYPDGVKIFVDPAAKGKIGGFAVSGRNPAKAGELEYFRVTTDSTRIYVDESAPGKGKIGGFAVSGRNPAKSIVNDYLVVTNDSTRIYVNDTATVKGKIGGFAVSGRNPAKGSINDYLQVTRDSTRIYVTESATKGKIGGFAVSGRNPAKGSLNDYLQVTKDSTRIYIEESVTKGKIGGFAVSGRNPAKAGLGQDYFNVSPNAAAEIINNESRVMWYPEKSALLAGELYIPSSDSVGQYSVTLGYKNYAIGDWSQAMGYMSVARGDYSTAIGYEAVADVNSFAFGTGTKALGYNSFAFGAVGLDSLGNPTTTYTKATGDYSFAFGLGSEAIGTGSFVLGSDCDASGDFATAAGFQTEASGFGSTAMGGKNISSGHYSLTLGNSNQAQGYASMAFGTGNIAGGNRSFAAGLGNSAIGVGAFALGVANNANGDGTFAAGNLNTCSQTYAAAFGNNNTSSGTNAFTAGTGNESSGNSAVSFGSGNTATGDYSLVIGSGNEITANGDGAFAAGFSNTASGYASIASGYLTTASGNYSTALGYRNVAPAYSSFVIGRYNESRTANSSTSWNGSDPVFVVGNGTGGVPSGNIGPYNDAFVIYQNGDVKVEGDIYPNVDDDYDLGSSGNRWQDIYTNGAVTTTSDLRLKTSIQNISYGLATVLQLRPVNYLWKDSPEKGVRLGLIAQEVQSVINEVVNIGDDENQTLGIRYSDLIPVLIKSIQEQQEIIEEQSQKNEELEKQLKEITERLMLLEQKVK